MEMIKVSSKQPNIIVRNNRHGFELRFGSAPFLEVPRETADVLIKNPNFEIVKGNEMLKKYNPETDLNKDGKNDEKDASLASKTMNDHKKRKKGDNK